MKPVTDEITSQPQCPQRRRRAGSRNVMDAVTCSLSTRRKPGLKLHRLLGLHDYRLAAELQEPGLSFGATGRESGFILGGGQLDFLACVCCSLNTEFQPGAGGCSWWSLLTAGAWSWYLAEKLSRAGDWLFWFGVRRVVSLPPVPALHSGS